MENREEYLKEVRELMDVVETLLDVQAMNKVLHDEMWEKMSKVLIKQDNDRVYNESMGFIQESFEETQSKLEELEVLFGTTSKAIENKEMNDYEV